MISATATPSEVRLRSLRSGYCLRKTCIRSPNDDGRRGNLLIRGIPRYGKAPASCWRERVDNAGASFAWRGAFLLPTVRRRQSINGLLYARERIREFGMR